MTGSFRGRFAPSPTGRLHLGNVRSALLGWLWARAEQGEFLLRIEDLDPERCKPVFTDGIFEDLEWLGLDWDGPVLKQSERGAVYDEAIAKLETSGRAYRCWCSRAEIARAASAPHVGEEGPVYPGTCRAGGSPKAGRQPSWRFLVEGEPVLPASDPSTALEGVRFTDLIHGEVSQDVAREVGDFIIRRIDGVASYQLAVVVDDALSGVTHVLRGEDLLSSTARQNQLQRALGYPTPEYAHVPLLMQADGKRLAKRDGASTVAGLRELGWSAEKVLGQLAAWSGLGDGAPVSARELVGSFSLERVKRTATVVE
ncbi:MAG: tRNA glutamyl-Q(34) synthetase GluQRS [Archangium sp.]|nr:tRNA glutamyl-Q(34) synthetase GluQRS [Archangium sp.]MDP3155854.1 tRNA glutamyl-Q(34) synthetase GluQRS [Archangium sp.]MDP3575436.1 tRNA glutamyl-Q(34) synthetase GluQRS [Archangium sp.]